MLSSNLGPSIDKNVTPGTESDKTRTIGHGIVWLLMKDPIERAKRYLHMESNANHHNRSPSNSQQFHQAISRESLFESEFHFEPKVLWKLPYLESRL